MLSTEYRQGFAAYNGNLLEINNCPYAGYAGEEWKKGFRLAALIGGR